MAQQTSVKDTSKRIVKVVILTYFVSFLIVMVHSSFSFSYSFMFYSFMCSLNFMYPFLMKDLIIFNEVLNNKLPITNPAVPSSLLAPESWCH